MLRKLSKTATQLIRCDRYRRAPHSVCAHALIASAERRRGVEVYPSIRIGKILTYRSPCPPLYILPCGADLNARAGQNVLEHHMKWRIDQTRHGGDGEAGVLRRDRCAPGEGHEGTPNGRLTLTRMTAGGL